MKYLLLFLVFLGCCSAQCANWTHIYVFDEWDVNTFIKFQQHIPSTVSVVRGWSGMNTELRLTIFANTQDEAKSWGFEITGDGNVASTTAFSLQVVPPSQDDAGEASDGSHRSWFVGDSVRLVASLAMISGSVFAESMKRSCTTSASVTIIMAPYYYDQMAAAVSNGVVSFVADQFTLTNVTATLDKDACLDTSVQSLYFTSCDRILTSFGLGLSSAADLLLTNVFLTSDPNNTDQYQGLAHQDCALIKFRKAIGSAASVLVPYDTLGSAQYNAINNLQSSVETSNPDVWNTFAREYTNTDVCVNWTVRADLKWGPSYGDAGCDPNGASCGLGDTCSVNDANGVCQGTDFTNPWGESGSVSLRKRSTILAGPACSGNHPLTGKPGVCISTSACASKGGQSVRNLCPQYGADILCCAGQGSGFLYQYAGTVLSGPACSGNHPLVGRPGVCISTSACAAKGGQSVKGLCPQYGADILCCAGVGYVYQYPSDGQLCGDYAGQPISKIEGNGGVVYSVVPILKAHLVDPTAYGAAPDQKDNTMEVATACAFSKLRNAALSAGVNIKISSGFRTLARQKYFYNCYQCKCCNGGNLAAVPGTSNHGKGIALDLNTDCGKQSSSVPSACLNSAVYKWLRSNGQSYGFVRTVQSEPWHWEYRPGTAKSSYT